MTCCNNSCVTLRGQIKEAARTLQHMEKQEMEMK